MKMLKTKGKRENRKKRKEMCSIQNYNNNKPNIFESVQVRRVIKRRLHF
jgi:hypothetical protein